MKSIMRHLRDMREDHDYSQAQIASVLGIAQQVYSQYEREEHEFPLRHFITLANFYHVSADYLIGRCDFDEKQALDMVYVAQDYSCRQLLDDTLSLNESNRKSVIEYIELMKLKQQKEEK